MDMRELTADCCQLSGDVEDSPGSPRKISYSRKIERMPRYKVILQYVGTRYAGWQIQKDQQTVQGKLKDALHKLTGEVVTVVGAGRTDSGVHAMEQVGHFTLSQETALEKLFRGTQWSLTLGHSGYAA